MQKQIMTILTLVFLSLSLAYTQETDTEPAKEEIGKFDILLEKVARVTPLNGDGIVVVEYQIWVHSSASSNFKEPFTGHYIAQQLAESLRQSYNEIKDLQYALITLKKIFSFATDDAVKKLFPEMVFPEGSSPPYKITITSLYKE